LATWYGNLVRTVLPPLEEANSVSAMAFPYFTIVRAVAATAALPPLVSYTVRRPPEEEAYPR
jgi:hypothetical protein